MTTQIVSETLQQVAELASPVSSIDVAALAAVGIGSAAYLLRGIVWDKPDPYAHLWYERPQFKDGFQGNSSQATRNIAEKLEQSNRGLVIFWGSQSGTAETFANRLARECHLRFGLEPLVADLSDYDPESISQIPQSKLAIFLVSTFGEGDPSDNTAGLWEWMHKDTSKIKLPNLRYGAFGLGNSNYKYYNRVLDVVTEVLDNANAQRVLPVGRADDSNGGTEEDFLAWKDDLFTTFTDKLNYQERDSPYEPSLTISEDASIPSGELNHGTPQEQHVGNQRASSKTSPIKAVQIVSSHELYTSSSRNCIHMELDIGDHAEIRYKTGDHLLVYPTAPDEEIELLLKVLGLQDRRSIPVRVSPIEEGSAVKVPSPTTVEALFRYYLEICAPVSRDIIRDLARFAPSPAAKSLLASLARDKESYSLHLGKNHVTIARLLAYTAPGETWSNLPLSYILESIPLLKPRYYSISSSSTVAARRLAITVGVENTPLSQAPDTQIRGLTTNYLLALANSVNSQAISEPSTLQGPTYALSGPAGALAGHKVFAAVRRSKFKLPTLATTPLIMVAAGTGIAPFRAFIQERQRLKAVGKEVGRMLLFFGCRRPDEDFLYEQEFKEAAAALDGALEVIPAFSRADGAPRTYVQDQVNSRAAEVCEMLDSGASLFICGRAAMAREVGRVVQGSMMKQNGWEEPKASGWSESMKKGNKWLEDVWG
ncbi:NADP/FAD dependent oxidoreductase [Seiridium cupressi]